MTSQSQRKTWLGRIVALMAALSCAGVSSAAPIAYDDLEGASLGTVNNQTSGTGFTEAYIAKTNAIVVSQSLSYSNGDIQCGGGAQCVRITYPDATVFTRAIGTQNSDTLYMSFLFNTPTADGSSSSTGSNEDFLSFGLNNAVGETSAGVVHRYNSTSTDHAFGIRTNSTSGEVRGSIGTESNRTYFVMLRLRKLTPGAVQPYNELALFVDPSTMYEPAPTLIVTNAEWAAATLLAARIALSEPGDTCYLDNLCVGATYNSVAYPTGDSPVADQPEITPRSGTILGLVTVTMTTPTAGATIRYTTDGSTPSPTNGTVYSVPFDLTASARVKAIAYIEGKNDSAITVADYKVQSHWVGGAADKNWSTVGNWDPAVNPAGTEVVFNNTGTNKITATNNIVDVNTTISSLSYTNSGNGYHVTHIGSGLTLRVDGSTMPVNAMFVGRTAMETKTTYTLVKMIGGGAFVIDANQSTVLVVKTSDNEHGEAKLDLSGLSVCSMTVTNFSIGRFDRSAGFVTLASTGIGSNTVTAARLGVGDSDGSSNGDTSELNLGRINVINVDSIGIGAAAPGRSNANRGVLRFQAGLTNPVVRIRGLAGESSRADLTIAGHGVTKTVRGVVGNAAFTNGLVDALIGNLVLADGRGYYASSGGIGTTAGGLSMSSGIIDATSVILGRTLSNSSAGGNAGTATGTLDINGGGVVAGQVSMADNNSGTGQNVAGILNVYGTGTVSVAGNVTLGTGSGTATGVVATVNLSGGALAVGGNVAPGNGSTNVVSKVFLNGGALSATNTAGDATVRIERGTFAIKAGSATVNRLVVTNALTVTQVELRGTGMADYGRVTVVGGDVLLGGNLSVSVTNYVPKGGDLWTVVSGTGQRTGTFASVSLPDGMKVSYTESGFNVAYPTSGTLVMVR